MLRSRLSTRLLRWSRPFGIVEAKDVEQELLNPLLTIIDIRHSEREIQAGVLNHRNFWHLPLCDKEGNLVTDHPNWQQRRQKKQKELSELKLDRLLLRDYLSLSEDQFLSDYNIRKPSFDDEVRY